MRLGPRAPIRRVLSSLLAGLISVFVAGGVLLLVAWRDTNWPRLSVIELPVPGLSREVDLLQVSDLHSRSFGPRQRDLARLLVGRRFDAVILTGDLLDSPGDDFEPVEGLLAVASGHSDRVFFVRGNHDRERLTERLTSLGVIDLEALGAAIEAAPGVALASGQPARAPLPATLAGSSALVLARHAPPPADLLRRAAQRPEGRVLVLSGHTHAGQVRLPLLGAALAPIEWESDWEAIAGAPSSPLVRFPELRGRHIRGLRRDGRVWSYVSPGLGTTVYPFRLFARAEMTVIRLVPER